MSAQRELEMKLEKSLSIRHMNVIGMDSFDDETLRRIFTTEIDWHFKVCTLKELVGSMH